eukprot:TRINITY_DN3788_c0_g1_i4.p1 TRINITY_DN3788_c0_g1~~TRINITY_DN3788_c0_g1_i4.p1  ORF type:complete len:168 (-),score=7.10 TRINITY_DN3788_c0_g1_i4:8-511(-)
MDTILKKPKVWLNLEPEEEKTVWDEINEAVSMSYKHRLYGFGICLGLAILCFIIALFSLQLLSVVAFALFYTCGNLLLLGSTFFLVGPVKQLKNMFKPWRLIASAIFVICMGLTIFMVIFKPIGIVILILVVIQFAALVWYAASYIPYAQSCIKTTCAGCCSSLSDI